MALEGRTNTWMGEGEAGGRRGHNTRALFAHGHLQVGFMTPSQVWTALTTSGQMCLTQTSSGLQVGEESEQKCQEVASVIRLQCAHNLGCCVVVASSSFW